MDWINLAQDEDQKRAIENTNEHPGPTEGGKSSYLA
jgi:hypothetical protein